MTQENIKQSARLRYDPEKDSSKLQVPVSDKTLGFLRQCDDAISLLVAQAEAGKPAWQIATQAKTLAETLHTIAFSAVLQAWHKTGEE